MDMDNTEITRRNRENCRQADRSYGVRNEIAELLGKPLGHDFNCDLLVVLDDETDAILNSTSNIGFGGIQGYFTAADGTRFNRSLGAIVSFG